MLGDNIYGGKSPADYKRKFEDVYENLLHNNVKFYASLGNHHDTNERFYKPFNMSGQRYYTIKKDNTEFFALDSTYMDPGQLEWLQKQLAESGADWKICFFHHPLYSDARYHGPDNDLRAKLEPIFQKFGVRVVLSGHEHVYERIKPQSNIWYFVMGNAGQLRAHDSDKRRRWRKDLTRTNRSCKWRSPQKSFTSERFREPGERWIPV